jgi:hypothetical protein
MTITISSLHIYPVKSLQGIALQQATLTTQGLAFDRQWMVVDANGHFVTQRQLPNMAQIRVSLTADTLVLEHDSQPPLTIALHSKPTQRVEVVVWRDHCAAADEGNAASQWLTQILGQWQGGDLRLVRFADDFTRPVDPNYMNGDTADTAFSDGYPFLIVSEASLQALNAQLEANGASPVPMTRFRPNIVISGIEAFGEDRCATLTAATQAYRFAIRKPCQRCKITTVDPQTGVIADPKEPLKTLAAMNPFPHLTGAYFGQNTTLTFGDKQVITVGDLQIVD